MSGKAKASRKQPIKKAGSKKSLPVSKSNALASSHVDKDSAYGDDKCICHNAKCKLRKGGCKGFIACPGFKH